MTIRCLIGVAVEILLVEEEVAAVSAATDISDVSR